MLAGWLDPCVINILIRYSILCRGYPLSRALLFASRINRSKQKELITSAFLLTCSCPGWTCYRWQTAVKLYAITHRSSSKSRIRNTARATAAAYLNIGIRSAVVKGISTGASWHQVQQLMPVISEAHAGTHSNPHVINNRRDVTPAMQHDNTVDIY